MYNLADMEKENRIQFTRQKDAKHSHSSDGM